LRRGIQRLLEDPLSEQILAGQWDSSDMIEAFVGESGTIEFRKGEGTVTVAVTPPADETPKAVMPKSTPRARRGSAADGAAGA
jgi:ATP-dependent Clp protease ATP-binding subunit ClpC